MKLLAGLLLALAPLQEGDATTTLQGFEALGYAERRQRAELLQQTATPATLPRILELLQDPDPEVRRRWARLLGAASLADGLAEERIEALTGYAAEDPDRRVREDAVRSLSRSALPGAVAALDRLLERVPPDEAAAVALTLAGLPGAERRLVTRVQQAFRDGTTRDPRLLAVLLAGYGRALAELPRGGAEPVDRVPFLHGARHPSRAVQAAARSALNDCLGSLLRFAQYERADALLASLSAEGWDAQDLLYRRTGLALSQEGDPAASLSLALALERAAGQAPPEEAATWRFYGLHLQGASHFARGELEAARQAFARAAVVLQELLGERLDLSLDGSGRSPIGGAVMADRLVLLSVVELWQGLCLLARDRDASDAVFLEHLRQAHETLLQARIMAYASDSIDDFPAETLDALLERDLGPWVLVLSNPRLAAWSEGRGLDVMQLLCRGLATVAPWEMPGFERVGVDDARLTDPLSDPRRFAGLEALRLEHRAWLGRQRDEVRRRSALLVEVPQARRFDLLRMQIEQNIRDEQARIAALPRDTPPDSATRYEIFHDLVSYLPPSLFALTLGANLRVEGRLNEARRLGARLLDDLRVSRPGQGQVGSEWASARAELMIGSTYMDENRPKEAEEHTLEAVRRLQALENSLEQQLARVEAMQGDLPGLEGSIRQTRQMRANALLSLAVNANVRMKDTELALDYFEQAYELDQRDFMQVLRACYRARSGRAAEARAVLRGVRVSPPLYYNLACTHALLGETDEALDYLQRELLENHPSRGSLERQKAWAREDPDLASLHGNPRFERMVAADR